MSSFTQKRFLVLLLILFSANANAYIDPGSGSSLMTIIITLLVTIGVFFKTIWYKVLSLFKRSSDKEMAEKANESDISKSENKVD